MCHAITSITTYMGEGSIYLLQESLFCLKQKFSTGYWVSKTYSKKAQPIIWKTSISETRWKIHIRKHRLEKYFAISSYPVTRFHNYEIHHLQNICDGAMKAQHWSASLTEICSKCSSTGFYTPHFSLSLPKKGSLWWLDTNTFDKTPCVVFFHLRISQKGHSLSMEGKAS